jgi:hypothetical protein
MLVSSAFLHRRCGMDARLRKMNNVVDLCHNNAKTKNLSYNRIRLSSTLLLDLELSFSPDSPLHNSRPH